MLQNFLETDKLHDEGCFRARVDDSGRLMLFVAGSEIPITPAAARKIMDQLTAATAASRPPVVVDRDEVAAIEAKLRESEQCRREAGDLLHRLAMSTGRRTFAGLALSESASDPLAGVLRDFIRSFPIRLRE